jgi:geranyl-CoA carboxylase alpha subunit
MIRKVLIANRGEIACRIMRAAKARGCATVAVFSDTDARALHVRMADEAFRIGGPAPAESYLSIEAIIGAAKSASADAVHPGYGFLSERAEFAEACEGAGLTFIGPPASAIAAMGDKAESKRRMIAAGVPCIPGYQGEDQSDARLAAEAEAIGFPAMLKASAGGGGRGQRLVRHAGELGEAIASARREAAGAFGDDRLIVEKAIVGARHVEMQVIGDAHGAIVHLGERDCSLQRRRQKVIEESPSPVITPELRRAMGEAAVCAARAVDYRNAGTVEFLFDPASQRFYFLEMNTRIQVEHPVTECVTGLDLVSLQFDIAEGRPLPFGQDDVRLDGWAVEARLYAEDPARGFLPQTGRLARFEIPAGVRVDAGVQSGDDVTAHYDPMIAKVIACGSTRAAACARLATALDGAVAFGVTTNARFLTTLLRDETFLNGGADIGFIERECSALNARAGAAVEPRDMALAAAAFMERPFGELLTGWDSRGEAAFPLTLQCGDDMHAARIRLGRSWIAAETASGEACIEILQRDDGRIAYRHGEISASAAIERDGDVVYLLRDGVSRRFVDATYAPAAERGAGADVVKAPMAGTITSISVKEGDRVARGQAVAAIEAMKMEHRLAAPRDGAVSRVHVSVGEQVAMRALIVTLGARGG